MAPASASHVDYTPDNLLGGDGPFTSRKVTLLMGQNLTRGALLGRRSVGAAVAAAWAGNAGGTGAIGAVVVGAGAKKGVYKLVCIEPAANAGKFEVNDPDGVIIGVATVGVAFNAGGLQFTIADGATDFISGEGFDITVADGDGKYLLAAAAAGDGSQTPDLILAEDCDATAADQEALAYEAGVFQEDGLTLGAGITVAAAREGLRLKGILIVSNQSA